MIKKEKGIALVSLIITIVVMTVIASTVVYVSLDRFEINSLRKMFTDIELLQDKVSNYYLKYGVLPVLRDNTNTPIPYTYTTLNFVKNSADNNVYYIVDLEAMEGISLNYGKEGFKNPNTSEDVYIINQQSHVIYYVKGMTLKGVEHYTLSNGNNLTNDKIPPSTPQIKVISGNKNSNGLYLNMSSVDVELIPGKSDGNIAPKTEFSTNNGSTWTNINELDNNIYPITKTGQYSIKIRSYDKNDNVSENSLDLSVQIRDKKLLTAYSENKSWLDLPQSYLGRVSDYKIYGNSIQDTATNGEPSQTNPVEIQSVGDLVTDTTDSNYGKYKILVKASGKNLVNQNNFNSTGTNNVVIEEKSEYYDVSTSTNTAGIRWDLNEPFSVGDTITFQAKVKYISEVDDVGDSVTLRIWNATKSAWIHAGANGIETDYSTITKGVDKYLTITVKLTENNYSAGDVIQVRVTRGIKSTGDRLINFYVYKNSVMVQKNDTEIKYVPYVEPQIFNIYLEEPLRSIGEYRDYIDFENKKVVRNIGYILKDSADFTLYSSTDTYNQFVFPRSTYLPNSQTNGVVLCSYMKQIQRANAVLNNVYIGYSNLNLCLDTSYTLENVQELLNKIPMEICYQLATLDDTEAVDLPELKTFDEYTKIEILTDIAPSKVEATYDGYEIK